jgi:hypothetical protein
MAREGVHARALFQQADVRRVVDNRYSHRSFIWLRLVQGDRSGAAAELGQHVVAARAQAQR